MTEKDFLKPLSEVKPIFVVGCGRSGTSMLLKILNQHSSIAIPSESHFLIDYMKKHDKYETLEDDRVIEKLFRDILNEPFVKEFKAKYNIQQLVKSVKSRTYAGVVNAIYDTYRLQHNKARWGDKTPPYVHYINEILRIFPESQFIHIIRDGRDCALSVIEQPWGPKNIFRSALMWKRAVTDGMEQGRKLPPSQYIEIRYEKILTSPADELGRLFLFLDEPLGSDKLKAMDFKKGNYYKWKHRMSDRDKKIFEKIAGDLLEELGYERIYNPVNPLNAFEKAYYSIDNRVRTAKNIIFDIQRAWKLKFHTPRNVE
jgi:hypothetical protein